MATCSYETTKKKKVQDNCEYLTLWLEDQNPIEWFQGLSSSRAHRWLLVFGIVEFAVAGVGAFITQRIELSVFVDDKFGRLNVIIFQILALAISSLSIPVIVRKLGPRTMKWLLADAKPLVFVRRYIALVAIGYLIALIYGIFLIGLIWLANPSHGIFGAIESIFDSKSLASKFYLFGFLLIWPAFTYFWVMVQVGALVLWFVVLLPVLLLLLRLALTFAWRVVEYSKGAYAALLLIVTIILGILSLYLKGKP